MCLLVFAYNTHPDYYLILAANRDEFYERPTRSARFWPDSPSILAGKDLVGGGTWLGLHRDGRIAALTNHRDLTDHNPDAKSRGELVTDFLESRIEPVDYLADLNASKDPYNGYNLIAGTLSTLCHYSNREKRVNRITPGIHGISNAFLDTPWPKVKRAREELSVLIENGNLSEQALFHMLGDEETFPSVQLPDTGLEPEMEKAVSSCFIRTTDYGTRCSTLLFVSYQGEVRFVERIFTPGTNIVTEENGFDFRFRE